MRQGSITTREHGAWLRRLIAASGLAIMVIAGLSAPAYASSAGASTSGIQGSGGASTSGIQGSG
jgi:hypothetical protein